ncbi:MAG: M48 family metallopeptidase [Defluviitaleaceae bacterium]|nr:M48 family metallopeptidase [Defluviitaleaceae bacterium]
MIEYSLTHSKRKTVGIYIRDGKVEVRAPLKYPKSEIDQFVASKEKWIVNNLAKSQKQAKQKAAFALNYGDTISFRGTAYPLVTKVGKRAGFDGECFYLPPKLESDLIRDVCVKIYRHLAKKHLTDRVAIYAEKMGVTPADVKINSAKTRWGSCSSQKNINFSWRLIMADDDVIDYAVVHELAHIIQMNHSEKFWLTVENVLPDYKMCKVRLQKLQKRLATEDWG